MINIKEAIEKELERAHQARAKNNEGQARVCARRAAGIAVREYLKQNGRNISNPSAYDVLKMLIEEPFLDPALKQSAQYLTMRVDEGFNLPAGVDLITEARKLCEVLFKT